MLSASLILGPSEEETVPGFKAWWRLDPLRVKGTHHNLSLHQVIDLVPSLPEQRISSYLRVTVLAPRDSSTLPASGRRPDCSRATNIPAVCFLQTILKRMDLG